MRILTNGSYYELKCSECNEGVRITNENGVLLLLATNFITDHSDCKYTPDYFDLHELSPLEVLDRVTSMANNDGVTDSSTTNGGQL